MALVYKNKLKKIGNTTNTTNTTNMTNTTLIKFIVVLGALGLNPALATNDFVLGGKPFAHPLDTLRNGNVHFFCREVAPGAKGGGLMVFQFDVALGSPQRDPSWPGIPPQNEVTLSNVQIGSLSRNFLISWSKVPDEIFENSMGTIMFPGTKFERLEFQAEYPGAPLDNRFETEWSYQLHIEQDLQSMLVFAHYQTTHIVDQGAYCTGDQRNCEPRQSIIDNEVFLCEPQGIPSGIVN
jgi:hypothetical protein